VTTPLSEPPVPAAPAEPAALLARRLSALGLRPVDRLVAHANRTVMVSWTLRAGRTTLRLHRGYALAPDRVLRAIVRFLTPSVPRVLRRLAEREFLTFPVEEHAPAAPARRRADRPRPGDLPILARLAERHRALNALHFDGTLGEIPIRISGRMKTRLGELSIDLRTGRPIEIAISRSHATRHPWDEVEHTLLHEMVHQWQAETGRPVDHRGGFRKKAREVGILPQARRPMPRSRPALPAGAAEGTRRVAREG